MSARPGWRERDRCGVCRRRSPGYDLGEGRRRWRALDLGTTTFAFVEADAPRVTCRRHGVVVVAVPWARHDSRFTRVFEDQVCWLAVNCSKTAVASLMRVAWRSVGSNRGAGRGRGPVSCRDARHRAATDRIGVRRHGRVDLRADRRARSRRGPVRGALDDVSPEVGNQARRQGNWSSPAS